MKTTITKDQRRARMMERIQQHGETLLDLFPNAKEKDPVKLCKKLRRLETRAHAHATRLCNGEETMRDLLEESQVMEAVRRALGITEEQRRDYRIFLNLDARGYALKLDDAFVRNWNEVRAAKGKPRLSSDWGGYGILAPDFSDN